MKLKKYLSILMVLGLLVGLLPAAALAGGPAEVNDWAGLRAALAAGGSIVLTGDVVSAPGDAPLEITSGTAALDLNGHKIDGAYAVADDVAVAIVVDGGSLTVSDSGEGGAITGGNVGVWVRSGEAELTGGAIRGQELVMIGGVPFYGDCVFMDGDGAFTLRGGVLSGSFCGVELMDQSAMTMLGGEISGHSAWESGNISYCGIGVELEDESSFEMSGGTIRANEHSGVALFDKSACTMTGGRIADNGMSGVYLVGQETVFEMAEAADGSNHGVITGSGEVGVMVEDGTFRFGGGSIRDNAYGIAVQEGTLCLSGITELTSKGDWDILMAKGGNPIYVERGADGTPHMSISAIRVFVADLADDESYSFTSGLKDGGYVASFVSARDDHYVDEADDGEAELRPLAPVGTWPELVAAFTNGGGVRLAGDITAAQGDDALVVGDRKAVALDLGGHTLDTLAAGDTGFFVASGSLTLLDSGAEPGKVLAGAVGAELTAASGLSGVLTVKGGGICAEGTAVHVSNEAIVYLMGGTLTGGDRGVTLDVASGLLMSGGEITGCGAEGVYAAGITDDDTPALVYLSGGAIDGNGGCGVSILDGAVFAMEDGAIRGNCTALENTYETGGVYICGEGSNFLMRGGSVCDQLGCGVRLEGGTFAMTGGEIRDNSYDGVYILDGGEFLMYGGEISGNGIDSFPSAYGVYIEDEGSSFLMVGGCICDVQHGNGVFVDGGSFNMYGGEIHGCTGYLKDDGYYYAGRAVEVDAGEAVLWDGELYDCNSGVYVYADCAFTMAGGTIHSMKTHYVEEDDLYYGGYGVWGMGGKFTMKGGEITGCETDGVILMEDTCAAVSGGRIASCGWAGVCVWDEGSLTLSGAPEFGQGEQANRAGDLLLYDGAVVTLGGALEAAAPISISARPLPDPGRGVVLTSGLAGNGTAEDFVSALEGYSIKTTGAGEAILVNDTPASASETDGGGETAAPEKPEATKPGEAEAVTFTDVPETAWYASAADYAAGTGLFEGVVAEGAEVAFEPDKEMDRAEAVRVLWNLAGKPPMEGMMPFDDVAPGSFYAAAAGWAGNAEIVQGTGAGFDPNAPITREQFAAMVYRYVQLSGKGFQGLWAFPLDFTDAGDVSDWAYEGMCWLVMNGVLNGMGDGTLNPQGVLTRAQTAALLQRLAEVLEA